MHSKAVTKSEQACIDSMQPQYDRLFEVWRKLAVKTKEELDKDPRIPLALDAMVKSLASELHDMAHTDNPGSTGALTQYIQGLMELCVYMFRFGQVLLQQDEPLRYEDLKFCNCGVFTEEDARKLLTPTPRKSSE